MLWICLRKNHNTIFCIRNLQQQLDIEGGNGMQAKKRKSGVGSIEAAEAKAGSQGEESDEEDLEQPGLD